jgi:hypothetical protein
VLARSLLKTANGICLEVDGNGFERNGMCHNNSSQRKN